MVHESHNGSHVSDEELSEDVFQDPPRVFYSQAAANTFANAFMNQIGTLFDAKIGKPGDKIDALTNSSTELVHNLQHEQGKKPMLASAPPQPELELDRSPTFIEFPPISMARYTSQDCHSGTFGTNTDSGK